MEYFQKLNKAWREGIDAQLMDCDGGEHPDVAAAFKEYFAHHLSEVIIARKPRKADLAEVQESYIDYLAGWEAARR